MNVASPAPPPPAPGAGLLTPGFAGRLALAGCASVVLAYLLLTGLTVGSRGGPTAFVVTSDLISNLSGAAILEQGQPQLLYDRPTQTAIQAAILLQGQQTQIHVLPFIHLPFEALLIAPLHAVGLSYVSIFVIWTLLGLAAVGGSLIALGKGWPLPRASTPLVIVAMVSFLPLYLGLLLGQSTAFLLLAWAGGSAALRRGSDGWAGVIFALAAIKPQALPVLLFVLLITRRWRTLGAFLGTVGGAVALTLPLLGWDWPVRYAQLALSVGGYPPDPMLNPTQMQNWRGLFTRTLGDTPFANTLTLVVAGLSLALVACLWLGPGRAAWQPGSQAWNRRWAATLLANLLITPYLLPHDLALVLVPAWILAADALARADRRLAAWLWLGWALGFLLLSTAIPIPPAVPWLVGTVGWLLWQARPARATPITA